VRRDIGCNQIDHEVSRRSFVAGSAAGAAAVGGLLTPAQAEAVKSGKKRILQVFLQGGVSQFESWDPKPGTKYGGPFRSIPTSVPGTHICELLPHTAKRMHLLSIVRSVDLKTNDHRIGRLRLEKGRTAGEFPYVGSVASKYLHISTRGIEDNTNAFLGAQHAQLKLLGVNAPENLARPAGLDEEAAQRRNEFRRLANERFAGRGGQPAFTEAFDSSFEMARRLMKRKSLFEKEPSAKDVERYGSHPFGVRCILARELLNNGATCVKVTHHGYDTHAENFNFHLEQLDEFDKTFCMLLDDLHDSGMLESTLVLVYSEFGRTPKLNQRYGRDHWGASFSVALGGCGIVPGVVVGSTNADGTEVAEREVGGGQLFHTYFRALGLDTSANHDIAGRPVPIGDPAVAPIEELLA
jgi:hypothetical protein